MRRGLALALLSILLACVGSGLLRASEFASKYLLTNDEGWTYLATTCNEGSYYETIRAQRQPLGG